MIIKKQNKIIHLKITIMKIIIRKRIMTKTITNTINVMLDIKTNLILLNKKWMNNQLKQQSFQTNLQIN